MSLPALSSRPPSLPIPTTTNAQGSPVAVRGLPKRAVAQASASASATSQQISARSASSRAVTSMSCPGCAKSSRAAIRSFSRAAKRRSPRCTLAASPTAAWARRRYARASRGCRAPRVMSSSSSGCVSMTPARAGYAIRSIVPSSITSSRMGTSSRANAARTRARSDSAASGAMSSGRTLLHHVVRSTTGTTRQGRSNTSTSDPSPLASPSADAPSSPSSAIPPGSLADAPSPALSSMPFAFTRPRAT